MKKLLCLLLASLMVIFSVVSCAKEDKKDGKSKSRKASEKIEAIEKFVEENKETVAELGYEIEARGTTVAFIYTLSEEEYRVEYNGELSDALKLTTIDGEETKTMMNALKEVYVKNGKNGEAASDIKSVVFEYRAPDGTVLATEVAG